MTATVSTTELLTTMLNRRGGGATVLAKLYKGSPSAKHFANLTQARAAAAKAGECWHVMAGHPFYVARYNPDGSLWFAPAARARATIKYLAKCQTLRATGAPVSYTTDPGWLLDMAIGRRAGWVEDPHSRGICMPVNGKLPKKASGDMERHLVQLAARINTPNLIVRPSELGSWRSYLLSRLPGRFTNSEDE